MADSPLATYLDATKTNSATFAAKLGVPQSTVWRWRTGARSPSTQWAVEIEKLTGGAVKVTSWPRKRKRRHARTPRTN